MYTKKSRPRLVPGKRQAKSPINIIAATRAVCNACASIAYDSALALVCVVCAALWAVSYGTCAASVLWGEVKRDAEMRR